MTVNPAFHSEPIAIVGIGCRFPGANGPDAFWRLLVDGVDAITEVPPSRFDIEAFYDPTPGSPGKIASRFGGFVDNIERFDAGFFGIAPREAETMDPQQRILLEIAYEALEDAGLPPDRPGTSGTAVFLGIMSNDYLHQMYRSTADLDLTMAAGNSRGTAAARISQAFGFEGPSLVVDSDRASSLTALHFACRSLWNAECPVALAGASNAILGPELSIACSRSRILSPDGRCKFCDSRADGIGRSEGFGVLVLKRLADALRDGDRVYALIRGSAVTNNGSSSVDMMRPSARAQETLLRAALWDAGSRPDEIVYVEAHGTGTRVGDQAETEALGSVLGEGRPVDRPCVIGSVKTNIGHAEGAAGMAGVIKVALALSRGLIPKSLHFETPNPELGLLERRLRVQAQTGPWPANDGKPARAGVSAFGLTGTLAHVVLEAPPPSGPEGAPSFAGSEPALLPLSARSPESLDALAEAYRDWLSCRPDSDSLARLCYSASVHRQHHPYRLGLVASSLRELGERLSDYLDGGEPYLGARGNVLPGGTPKLAFVFPGQGGQWVGMGRELLAREPLFCDVIEACDDAIRREAGWSVAALLRGEADDALLEQIDYVQPTLTAMMVGLAALWRSWGIEPNAVLGFSMGEAAAAHVAGILGIEDAMAVVCRRTRLMKRLRGKGGLASVSLSLAEAEEALVGYGAELSVAVVAAPTTTVLSGDPSALRSLLGEFESRGLSCRQVKADVASHSVQMDGLLDELRAELAALSPRRGSIPLVSTVDDAYLAGSELDAEYWARNLRQPVLQMNGIARLLGDGFTVFLEVSPHPVAWNPLLETIRHLGSSAKAVASLRRDEGEREALLKSAGALHACGISPNWPALFLPEDRRFLPLPTYRWQEQSYWFEAGPGECPVASGVRAPAAGAAPPAGATRTRLLDQLRVTPSGRRREVLSGYLQGAVGRMLKLPDPAAIDQSAPLRDLGLTSLMSTELALHMEGALGHPCPATLFFNYPTIERLTDYLFSEGLGDFPPALVPPAEGVPAGPSTPEPAPAGLEPDSDRDGAKELEPIAVIGLACRFPGGAMNPDDFWRILRGGVDAITEVPPDRWDIDSFYDPDPDAPGKMYTRWGGFLDSIDRFDAGYFGISPREAEVLDPQQRLLLAVTVEALEHAGLAPDPQLGRDAGVYVGIMNTNEFVSFKGTSYDPALVTAHDSTGQATSAAAGRLSYALGFKGPSMAIDTACSSSLVAIHLACQALRAGECQVAVAGGVNVILAPEITISFCKTRMLSPTGRCKTFDARADGYVRGEGCGMVVLKRLSDAVRERDNVLAVVRGSAVNQDGRSSSLTAPNGLAQQAVVRRALEAGGIQPSEVDYVEAHGTGTALGDPIEIEALGRVLGEGRDARHPFLVGSVKTNIGHLESAAGVAGLIKIILSLQNEEIPPHLHLERVNPHISLEASKASIPSRLTPWPRGRRRRIAGISSFGFVGTNAHIVLEEAPEDAADGGRALPRPTHRLLALSARSPEALRELAGRYGRMLSRRSVDADDLCFTANTGRIHHTVRAAFVGTDADVLRAKIQAFAGGLTEPGGAAPVPGPPKVCFLFTGQGAQYPLVGHQLWEVEPVFRAALDRCAQIMDPLLPRPLLSILQDEDPAVLEQTRFAQPGLFALEYGLLEQWRAWGVEPSMVIGHSLGEYAAALAAGVLSLEEGAKLVITRGRLMQSIQARGGAAAVFAGEDFVRPFVEPYLDSVAIAADNAPERVLIAGGEEGLRAICDALEAKGIEVRRITGLTPAHSPLMDPILDVFETVGAMATYHPPAIPLVSTRTGRVITHAEISDPRHWRNLIRDKVRFREGMQVLNEAGCRIFVEIGPRHTLVRLGEMCLPFEGKAWLASLSKEKHDQQQMLESLAEIYVGGVRVRWEERHRPFAGRRVPLPTTVFEERRFWPELALRPPASRGRAILPLAEGSTGPGLLLGPRLPSPLEQVQFEARVDLASWPLLEDHRIFDAYIMPAAAHLVRVLAAAEQLTGRKRLEVRDAVFPEPMVLHSADDSRLGHLVLTPNGRHYDFQIASINAESGEGGDPAWRVHATGRVLSPEGGEERPSAASAVRQKFIETSREQLSGEEFYAVQARRGYALGASFQWLERVWLEEHEAWAKLCPPRGLANGSWEGLHPGFVDSCLQVASRLPDGAPHSEDEGVLVPAAVEGLRFFGDRLEGGVQGPMYCRVSTLPAPDGGTETSALAVFDESGDAVFSIAKLHLRRVRRRDFLGRGAGSFVESFRRLEWRESGIAGSAESGPGRWLVFTDEVGTGTALAQALRDRGQDAVLVRRGPEFEKHGETLSVNPAHRPDLDHLLAEVRAQPGPPWRGAVYLWGLDSSDAEGEGRHLRDSEALVCRALFTLVKAMIGGAPGADRLPLWVVTRGVQRTHKESQLGDAAQALLWGLGRVMASEHPALLGGLVDLDPHATGEDVAELLDELLARDGDTQVAYRGGKRLVPRLRPLERGRVRRFDPRPDATYLITGAFGALGRKVADWLVAGGARHLALLGRRAPDEEASRWLEGLASRGVQVLSLRADVSIAGELAEALAQLDRALPTLRGVIHAAGVVEDSVLSNLEWPSFARALAPKFQGSWNLHVLTEGRSLDFWVVCSSVSALLGNPGQAAYAAGNAYADALAERRRMHGASALSINWGPWQGNGMSAVLADDLHRRWGLLAIDPSDGVDMLGQLLGMEGAQAWAAPFEAEILRKRLAESPHLSLVGELVGFPEGRPAARSRSGTDVGRRLRDLPAEERRAAVLEHVVEVVRSVTAMDPSEVVRVDGRFDDLGVDSLLSLDLIEALNRSLGVSIPPTITIDCPTIELLTGYLVGEVGRVAAVR